MRSMTFALILSLVGVSSACLRGGARVVQQKPAPKSGDGIKTGGTTGETVTGPGKAPESAPSATAPEPTKPAVTETPTKPAATEPTKPPADTPAKDDDPAAKSETEKTTKDTDPTLDTKSKKGGDAGKTGGTSAAADADLQAFAVKAMGSWDRSQDEWPNTVSWILLDTTN